ncbi:MAG: DUF3365 domain-containing protein [bacterium]|nr:DUF3365 domain-containing protein [bacterium]MDI1336978.1 DUF3365 domain-containing protein [Lacunisphaera sp.]
MKSKIFASVGSVFFSAILLTALPAADKAPASAAPSGFAFVDTAGADVAGLTEYGSKTIEQVGALLISETARELATKETALAVSVLHLKNLELPKPTAGKPTVTAIKFTSVLVRNPLNTPDAADQAALDKIQGELDNDRPAPKLLLQRVDHAGAAAEWRVYRPIAATQSCLACHGDPEKFRPGVKEALDRFYPNDKATGYSAHEWRGFIRVSLSDPTVAAK